MSLATQCTSCSTVFRVVQDQLKVSEGWVRCGRCDAVFNALEGLFDLGRETPPDWSETRAAAIDEAPGLVEVEPPVAGPSVESVAEPSTGLAAPEDGGTPSALDELFADPVDAHLFGPRRRAESAPKPAGQLGARDRVEFSDARFDSDLFAENASTADTEIVESALSDAASLETTSQPNFIRRAERRARWRSAPARIALASAAGAAAVALLLQIGHHYRDTLASQWPPLKPAFTSWCATAGCTIEAPRHLQDVRIESSALTKVAGLDGVLLAVILRNRSSVAVKLPSVDLDLTDNNGRQVARRALAPRDFKVGDVLPAGAEAALQLTLTTGAVAVAGYTVDIFYP